MSISELSPDPTGRSDHSGPNNFRGPNSVSHKRIGHFRHVLRCVEQHCEQQPHHAVVLILTDENDVWTGTVRCDAWTQQDLKQCERVVERSARESHRVIVGLYDTGVAGRRWVETCAQRWPNIVMAYAVEESRWFSNATIHEGGEWATHHSNVRSSEPAHLGEGLPHNHHQAIPECAQELFHAAYDSAQRERDRALVNNGLWHMVDVWEWVLRQHELHESEPGPHTHTSNQFVGPWTHSLVHVVAAVCAQLDIATERERMIQQITVPCRLASTVEYKEVFTGEWGGPMSVDGLRAHRNITEYACAMTQAAGKGPHSTARAMLAWIEWAMGNHEQARQAIQNALLLEKEALADIEARQAGSNEASQQPLNTFAAQVEDVLDARSYPRWVEVPKR